MNEEEQNLFALRRQSHNVDPSRPQYHTTPMPMGVAYPNLKRFTKRDSLAPIIGNNGFGAVASQVIQNQNRSIFDQEANLEKFLKNVLVMPDQNSLHHDSP